MKHQVWGDGTWGWDSSALEKEIPSGFLSSLLSCKRTPGPTCLEQGTLGSPQACPSFLQHSNPEFLGLCLRQASWHKTLAGNNVSSGCKGLGGLSHSHWPRSHPGLTVLELEGPPGREAQGASKQVCAPLSKCQTQDSPETGPCHRSSEAQLSGPCWPQPSRVCQRFLNHAHIQSSQHPKEAGKAGMFIPILQMRK